MADLISPRAIANKYFINTLHAVGGVAALMRGRVTGPIGTELSHFYLCEVYPADDQQIAITLETVLALEQLVGVYFYPDRASMDAGWEEAKRIMANRAAQAKAARQREIDQSVAQTVAAFKKSGITVIHTGDVAGVLGAIADEAAAEDEDDFPD